MTGGFAQPLVITGNETEDVVITVSLSTDRSFEWSDNGDGVARNPAIPHSMWCRTWGYAG